MDFTDRNWILQPQNPATKAINKALKSKYQSAFQNWTEVRANKDAYNQFWNGFRSEVTWIREDTAAIEDVFNKKASRRLTCLLYDVRKKIKTDPKKFEKDPAPWLLGNSLPVLKEKWDTPKYQETCQKARENRLSEEGQRSCIHSGGSKSASTLRLEFILAHDRAPTFMEMNDLLHKFADSGEWTGLKAQEVARLTTIFTEEYDAEQQKLPPHLRDSEMIRAMRISKAFVDNAGGRHRGRKFAAGSTSSLYQSDPNGIRDVSCTSYSSTGRSQPQRDETDEEFEARIRASMREELREEVCKELEEDRLQTVERQVDQRFQTRWDEAAEAMAAIAQGQGSAQGSAPGSQVQQNSSNPPNNPSASQGYASSQEDRVPNSTNTQNIDLNQGILEYAQGDVLRSVDFDDLGTLRRMLHDDEYFMLNSYHTDGSGWGQKRQVLPPIIINEGGGGRSRGKVVGCERNNRNKGKRVQLPPEPEEDEYAEFSA
ncbi:hypothetical protein P8452_20830 [Trifolium repens]|nr:hypothetical protein P8452_20830 [Trifolium repens]